jgi:pyruvate, water dikinase
VGWLDRWRRRRAERPATRPQPSSLADRYARFREFIEHNHAVLATIADLQAKAAEGFPFELAYVRDSYERLAARLGQLVEALVALSDGHHTELRAAVARVTARGQKRLALPPIEPGPLVIPLAEVPEDARQVGGKALQLGRLTRAGLPVPPGFAVTAYGQQLFFERAGLTSVVAEELAGTSASDLEDLRRAGEAIRARVLAAELPAELARALAAQAASLGPRLAVRSSALHEDGDFSFAGQFESVLNVPAEDAAVAYKQVVASQFSPRALYYCRAHGFSPEEMAMAVLVMRMAEARVAGVLYGADPAHPEAGVRVINAVWGLGTLAVGGDVSPDIVRVDAAGEVMVEVGDKARTAEPLPAGGVAVHETPVERRRAACLSVGQALLLAELAARVQEQLAGVPQDIEWCLDAAGQLALLQARALRVGAGGSDQPLVAGGAPPVIDRAVIASRGVAAGRVHVIREPGEEVPLGCVLVARSPSLDFTVQLDRIRAMVCEVGSATSHLATVLREASLPALFGARQACELLAPGEVVTVDAFHGRVYRGRVEELLAARRPDPGHVRESRPYRVLRELLEDIVPLHLTDPRAAEFAPDRCDTFHDVTRYAHEMAMRTMFEVPEGSPEAKGAKRLQCDLPLDLWVIDLDRGLRAEAASRRTVTIDDVLSRPFRAYWRGVTAAGWTGPKPVDLGGFMSVVMSAATNQSLRDRMEERNFALLADSYMSLANRLGFHFAVIDSYLHDDDDSHVALTFYGGGADIQRRVRRVEFLTLVLRHLDFRVQRQRDFLVARIDGYDVETLEERLDALGRLMMAAKQLDMVMFSDAAARQFAHDFITGGYRLAL